MVIVKPRWRGWNVRVVVGFAQSGNTRSSYQAEINHLPRFALASAAVRSQALQR